MNPDPFEEFRRLISQRARQVPQQWDASKRLLEGQRFSSTIAQLLHAIEKWDLPANIREALVQLFRPTQPLRVQDLNGEALRKVTGLPPAKAIRALCIYFELTPLPRSKWPVPRLSSEDVEQRVRSLTNPFDLLCQADVASVLDIGAGDLSFAEELANLYMPILQPQDGSLTLHCVDRLDPRSQLGGPLHADPSRLRRLQQRPGLSFSFFGNQDIFQLQNLDGQDRLASRYTIATCWAPATPTFAYEPSRLSSALITEELTRTKGSFHLTRFGRESALEVLHGQRTLLFPPWKFEIVGPLALLQLLANRGSLCLLGSVDDQVFWEILAQLLEAPRYRPRDLPFTLDTIPCVFGDIYQTLVRLPLGGSVELADLGTLRRDLLSPSSSVSTSQSLPSFRYIRISRGATFPGMPASSTARKFSAMTEERPPWFLTLVPA